MKTYEYSRKRIEVRLDVDFERELNDLGKKGWELVQILTPITQDTYFASAVFKREIYKNKMACGMP